MKSIWIPLFAMENARPTSHISRSERPIVPICCTLEEVVRFLTCVIKHSIGVSWGVKVNSFGLVLYCYYYFTYGVVYVPDIFQHDDGRKKNRLCSHAQFFRYKSPVKIILSDTKRWKFEWFSEIFQAISDKFEL